MLAEIKDPKLLTRVRKLLTTEHAGYVREGNLCIEPGCSCEGGAGDSDPVSGPFRTPAVRCSSFEELVLPLDRGLEEAYWQHVEKGQPLVLRRCAWERCRREVGAINAKYCNVHALLAKRRSSREYAAKRRAAKQAGSR